MRKKPANSAYMRIMVHDKKNPENLNQFFIHKEIKKIRDEKID